MNDKKKFFKVRSPNLNNFNFWCFNRGRLISLLGTGVQAIAIPLYILDVTGKGFYMEIFSIVSLLPVMLVVPFAGILGDRKNRKNIMIYSDFARGIILISISLLAMFNRMNIVILFITQVFISILDSVFNAASSSILPELVEHEKLMKANSLKATIDAIANLLGPVLGGMLYGLFGIKIIFIINAVSFCLSGMFEMLRVYNKKVIEKQGLSRKEIINENKEVLSFILKNKGLLQLFSFAMIANLLSSPVYSILYPYIFRRVMHFTSQQYGYIEVFFTCGMLLANIVMAFKLSGVSAKKLMKTGFTVTPLLCVLKFDCFTLHII